MILTPLSRFQGLENRHAPLLGTYSKVPNKRSATFINFRKIFQGLRSYLEGVRLLVLTKYFLQVRKVGFKIPNSMKFILFEEGGTLI